ncbi:hypothetical protein HFO68_34465, partial [Rhizobium laguerreae]|uniref:hypothetical protein n=1 Tax=Rhizobium laguerreae TaxID=1076926 RepID=UPI001C919AF1
LTITAFVALSKTMANQARKPFVFLTTLTPSRCALIRMKQGADINPSGTGRWVRNRTGTFPTIYGLDHKDRAGAPLVTGLYVNPSFLCDPSVPKLPRFGGASF